MLGGTNGNPLTSYRVLASMKLNLPTTNWQAVATNSFDAAGRFSLTNLANPALPQQFLIIRSP